MRSEIFIKEKRKIIGINLITKVSYVEGERFGILTHNEIVEGLVIGLKIGFAEIEFRISTELASKYSKRVLKIAQRKTTPNKEIKLSIDEYRFLIGNSNEIKPFSNFRRKSIEPLFKEIIEKSNSVYVPPDKDGKRYELIKLGRSYSI